MIGTKQELKENQLWIPKSSNYYENSKWIEAQGLQEEQPHVTHIIIATKKGNGNLLKIKYLASVYFWSFFFNYACKKVI